MRGRAALGRNVSRRAVLLGGAGAMGALGLSSAGLAAGTGAGWPRLVDPFTLGVASGDPTSDGVVLWTRLAPFPLADDGMGGMPDRVLPVEWQIARDEQFTKIVQSGVADAAPELGHSVHMEAMGLEAGAEYFYRFRVDGEVSPAGRTRTAPAPGASSDLTMCFASCARYGDGYFTAYRRMAEDEPALVLFLGDYQYEYPAEDKDVRVVAGPETRTLANYRQRHAQYKTDPDLQLVHAIAPWLVVWDDHEIENNWAGDVPEDPDPTFPDRRKAAFQAFYENMPLRSTALMRGGDMRLYRRVQWGGLANFHMLDTRQYRTDQPCGDEYPSDCAQRFDPASTIMGAEQEQWLTSGLRTSGARWDVLGQQVFFSQLDLTPGAGTDFNPDAWDGYIANRDRIATALSEARNAVVLTGDVHRHWAAEVKSGWHDPESPTVATEFVTTSITSGGDGSHERNEQVLAENPHLKFYKDRRGYVRIRFNTTELRADYRVLPYVQEAGAPAETARSFVVSDGEPRLDPA